MFLPTLGFITKFKTIEAASFILFHAQFQLRSTTS